MAEDLTEAALEAALVEIDRLTAERGERLAIRPERLVLLVPEGVDPIEYRECALRVAAEALQHR